MLSNDFTSTASWEEVTQDVNPRDLLDKAERFRRAAFRHALLCWVVLPLYILLQAMFPFSAPNCQNGFSDLAIIALAAVLLHYLQVEREGWISIKGLLSLPEKTIMKSLAIFKLRKWKFLFGFIMVLDLYTDVTFPFMARSCDMDLTTRWQVAWGKIPFFGIVLVGVLEIFKFWGLAMVFILIHISLDGGFGICHMITATELVYDGEYGSGPRVTSQMFFSVAENSDTALLPSVAMFCREMANQKKVCFQ